MDLVFIVDRWDPCSDLEWLGRIGDGSTSVVAGARRITDGTIGAVKMINIFKHKRPEFFINEVNIGQQMVFQN